MDISVVICSHNPREDYLRRTLAALNNQTLPKDQWELLLVDNASAKLLADEWDVSWHPNERHVREEELGLTPARLRGIEEAKGSLLVFVDDDNVLAADYLAKACEIAESHPWMGAFGGSTIGEYEQPPAESVRFMLPQLAVRHVQEIRWACQPGTQAHACAPCGAGMVVRDSIGNSYRDKTMNDPLRRKLDRVGSSLSSAGDSDLAFCACEAGYAVGLFPALCLKHLIPSGRLERNYLIRLAEGMSFSHSILDYIWERRLPAPPPGRMDRLIYAYHQFRRCLGPGRENLDLPGEIHKATLRGRAKARLALLTIQ